MEIYDKKNPALCTVFKTDRTPWSSLVGVKDGHGLGPGPESLTAEGSLMSRSCRTLLLATLGVVLGVLIQS